MGRGASLPLLYRTVAAERADSTAVRDGTDSLSYGELDRRSDALAARLVWLGIRRGERVGVLVDRSASSVVSVLAVLKSGAAYVPLDPTYPQSRLRYIIEDAGIRKILDPSQRSAEIGLDAALMVIVGDQDGEACPVPDPTTDIRSEDPAYVIYTSGSTGVPKGCSITHGNVLSLLSSAIPLFDLGPSDLWTLFHSLSFDFSVWELWGAFSTGATVVVVPFETATSPDAFVGLLACEQITVLNQVPSVFRNTVRAHADAGSPRLALRQIVFGGEMVDLEAIANFLKAFDGLRPDVVNMYGLTEVTVHSTFKRLTDADLSGTARSPIGRPLPNLTIDIRDDDGKLLPSGETGEMWIAGDAVAGGYLGRPELTAQRFVTMETDGQTRTYYRTGDLARLMPNGELDYVGRADTQVKVLGFRIELGEIEVVLKRSPALRDAAVVVARTRSGSSVLVACVVPNSAPGRTFTTDLRRHLTEHLPRHMVPVHYEVMESLPLTASGKTDRAALGLRVAGTFRLPRTSRYSQ